MIPGSVKFAERLGDNHPLMAAAVRVAHEFQRTYANSWSPTLDASAAYYEVHGTRQLACLVVWFPVQHGSAFIALAWTDPAFRRQGIYREVFKELIAHCRKAGMSMIECGVDVDNPDSMATHLSFGMKHKANYYRMPIDL